ncbi:hypothetical protein RFI_22461 [Reticulomyxa filosa]|uniref:Uncharacterized protein n=1 Tax=Reticulomyxa filosa TaxID=46433 RepID=X6MND0_RETFI|nr:hypothetical protein RFI_22461 [Reticulomyxa filosa]|eukprot:ETO14907.1 hypothetical protein RFI_22461 [Reticulomyxa filosa]
MINWVICKDNNEYNNKGKSYNLNTNLNERQYDVYVVCMNKNDGAKTNGFVFSSKYKFKLTFFYFSILKKHKEIMDLFDIQNIETKEDINKNTKSFLICIILYFIVKKKVKDSETKKNLKKTDKIEREEK